MRRGPLMFLITCMLVPLSGCVGDTDPASHLRATQAQLNAHGHTNNGPASWWWEYSTSETAVKNGTGTDTAHVGPASSSADVPLSEVVTHLASRTTYFYRACGQDQSSASQICGRTLSFKTAPGDSQIRVSTGVIPQLIFTGDTQASHNLTIAPVDGAFDIQDPVDAQSMWDGTSIIPGAGCQTLTPQGDPYDSYVRCTSAQVVFVVVTLSDLADQFSGNSSSLPVRLQALDGNDAIAGGGGNDYIDGGGGNDQLSGNGGLDQVFGGIGNDVLYGGDGDKLDCGTGLDIAHVATEATASYAAAHGCETVTFS